MRSTAILRSDDSTMARPSMPCQAHRCARQLTLCRYARINAAGEGNDAIAATISYTLPDNVERLVLAGHGAIDGTGNALANVLTGNDAANALSGRGGNDIIAAVAGHPGTALPSSALRPSTITRANCAPCSGTAVISYSPTSTATAQATSRCWSTAPHR